MESSRKLRRMGSTTEENVSLKVETAILSKKPHLVSIVGPHGSVWIEHQENVFDGAGVNLGALKH